MWAIPCVVDSFFFPRVRGAVFGASLPAAFSAGLVALSAVSGALAPAGGAGRFAGSPGPLLSASAMLISFRFYRVFHNHQYDSADFEEISPMTTSICEINSQSAKSIFGFERRSK